MSEITAKAIFDAWVAKHPNARQVERRYAMLVAEKRAGVRKGMTFGYRLGPDQRAEIRSQVDVEFEALGGTPPVVPENFRRAK